MVHALVKITIKQYFSTLQQFQNLLSTTQTNVFFLPSGGTWSNIDTHLVCSEAVWSVGTKSAVATGREGMLKCTREAMFPEKLTNCIFS